MKLRQHIPNIITALNLLSGCLAIVMAFEYQFNAAILFLIAGALFDFMDGMAARALDVYSDIGKELDSLADIISFGAAPAFIIHNYYRELSDADNFSAIFTEGETEILIMMLLPFLIAVMSGFRLAKFNIDPRQKDHFIGLPTPANALFFVSLIWLSSRYEFINDLLFSPPWLIALLILIFSFLLVAEFPMFSLKFKNLRARQNEIRYIFIGISAILLISLQLKAIPLIIIIYILLSMINNRIARKV